MQLKYVCSPLKKGVRGINNSSGVDANITLRGHTKSYFTKTFTPGTIIPMFINFSLEETMRFCCRERNDGILRQCIAVYQNNTLVVWIHLSQYGNFGANADRRNKRKPFKCYIQFNGSNCNNLEYNINNNRAGKNNTSEQSSYS